MQLLKTLCLSAFLTLAASAQDWQVLFDGKSIDGWKAAENPDSIKLEDGCVVFSGKRAHLFWMGQDGKASFGNFEAEIVFQSAKGSNAGLFFHTAWQDKGWPQQGLECQINATHTDWRKTGSVYSFQDVKEPGHNDGEWVTMKLRVEGLNVKVWVNDKLVNDWTQPATHPEKTKRLGSGTFALQAHDPGSVVKVKSLRVKALP
jgi:Domain of Unknown Function (DUF1080)